MMIGFVFIALLSIDVLLLHGDSEKKSSKIGKNEKKNPHTSKCSHCVKTSEKHVHTSGCSHGHSHDQIGTCNTSTISKSTSKIQALVMGYFLFIFFFISEFCLYHSLFLC